MKIGLVIMLAELRALGRVHRYPEIRQAALRAEEAGFDSLWLYDHLLYREQGKTIGIWDCWTMLSALAEATHKVELGTLVLCNSFRNPGILAKMAAGLDEVSGGRFILGIGAGWNEPEYQAFGLPYDHLASRFEEAIQVIAPLVRTGKGEFSGQYYQTRDCEITPRGPRPSGPPILVGCGGARMMRITAKYADMWNAGYFGDPQGYEKILGEINAACTDVGRDPATLAKTALLFITYPGLGAPPDFEEQHLTGAPEQIAEALHGYERLGVDTVMLHLVPYSLEAIEQAILALNAYKRKM